MGHPSTGSGQVGHGERQPFDPFDELPGTMPGTGRTGWQEAAALSSNRASRHVPSASLGHYASLSFVVIGRGQKTGLVN